MHNIAIENDSHYPGMIVQYTQYKLYVKVRNVQVEAKHTPIAYLCLNT